MTSENFTVRLKQANLASKSDIVNFIKKMWKFDGMSEESFENIAKSDSNFAPTFVDHHLLPDMKFYGDCLMKHKISIPKKVINLYISYPLGPQLKFVICKLRIGKAN